MLAYLFALLTGARSPPTWLGLTLDDLHNNLALFGATGSGKTVCLKTLVRMIARSGHGLFCPVVKPGELGWILRAVAPRPVVLVAPGSPVCVNPLDAVPSAGDPESEAVQLAAIFSSTATAVQRLDGHTGGGDNASWEAQAQAEVRMACELLRRAGVRVTFESILDVILTAADSLAAVQSEAFKNGANRRACVTASKSSDPRVKRVLTFWLSSRPAMPPRQQAGILAQVLPALYLLNTGEVGRIFNSPPTHTLAEIVAKGQVLVCNFDPPTHGQLGIAVLASLKDALQRAALKRVVTPDSPFFFNVLDEFPLYCSEFDATVFATARSAKFPTVIACQGVESLHAAFPDRGGEARTDVIVGNTGYRLFARPTPRTAKYLTEALGSRLALTFSGGGGQSSYAEVSDLFFGSNQTPTVSFSQSQQPWVTPHELANLRSGSDDHGKTVEIIVTPGANAPYRRALLTREDI